MHTPTLVFVCLLQALGIAHYCAFNALGCDLYNALGCFNAQVVMCCFNDLQFAITSLVLTVHLSQQ